MKSVLNCLNTEVLVAENFQDLSWEIGKLGRNVLWIFDSNTALMVRPLPEPHVILQSGKSARRFESVIRLLDEAYENKMDRDTVFLALGGRTISDVTSFASSLWMYGSRFVNIPTTLSAMVETSIGTKYGLDFKSTRNSVGVKHSAEKTILCFNLLKSLSLNEYLYGLACLLKYSCFSDQDDFSKKMIQEKNKLIEKNPDKLQDCVEECLQIRKKVIEEGNEASLDFGNEFSNALSVIYADKYSKGTALAWSVTTAARIAADEKICTIQYANSIIHIFKSYNFDIDFRIGRAQWMEMRSFFNKEKKFADGKITLSLPVSPGKVQSFDIDEEVVKKQVIQNAIF